MDPTIGGTREKLTSLQKERIRRKEILRGGIYHDTLGLFSATSGSEGTEKDETDRSDTDTDSSETMSSSSEDRDDVKVPVFKMQEATPTPGRRSGVLRVPKECHEEMLAAGSVKAEAKVPREPVKEVGEQMCGKIMGLR